MFLLLLSFLIKCVLSFVFVICFLFFKQKTAYEMRISDWSSDVCSSDLTDCVEKSFTFSSACRFNLSKAAFSKHSKSAFWFFPFLKSGFKKSVLKDRKSVV